MGGLSESVVKQSSSALLRWCRACKAVKNLRALAGLALRLVEIFGDAGGDPRVVVPLLKTVEVCSFSVVVVVVVFPVFFVVAVTCVLRVLLRQSSDLGIGT